MKKIFIILFSFIYLFLIGSPISSNIVYANDIVYTDVLSDLQKDENFDKSNYIPSTTGDIEFIQLSESVNKELFIYVYVENASISDLKLSSINISTSNDELDFINYKLTSLSSSERFYKYLVNDLVVLDEKIRKYDITSVFTKSSFYTYDSTGTSEYAFDVSQSWTAETINNNVVYSKLEMDVVTITDKKVGYLRYSDGFRLSEISKCDSHYIAFNTDKEIDKLLSADVYFYTQDYSCSMGLGLDGEKNYDELIDHYIHLTHTDTGENFAKGWFAKEYTWNRIETIEEFKENENLTETTLNEISNMSWILRFYESEYSIITGTSVTSEYGTSVYDVTILKLTFETNGIPYDLGVIDNKTNDTTPDEPDNEQNNPNDTCDWFCELKKKIEALIDNLEKAFKAIGFILIVVLIYLVINNFSKIIDTIRLNKLIKNNTKKKK